MSSFYNFSNILDKKISQNISVFNRVVVVVLTLTFLYINYKFKTHALTYNSLKRDNGRNIINAIGLERKRLKCAQN